MSSETKGIYPKYIVTHADTGEQAEGDYFILKAENDAAARAALRAYADTTENRLLAADLRRWVEQVETRDGIAQEESQGASTIAELRERIFELEKAIRIALAENNVAALQWLAGVLRR